MSTIPFTPIEGYLALPRLRPLGHVPAPFGRDWALLPPGYSWRTELKALYAALLRTFCMSDQAILSFCRWSPLDEPEAVAAGAAVARPTVFETPRGEAAQVISETATIPLGARPANHWPVLAGGVCALGGAAVLAWIGVDHLAHRHTSTHASYASTVSTRRDSQAATVRPSAAAPAIAKSAAGASALVAASGSAAALALATPSAPGSASAPASPSTLAMAPPHDMVSQALPPRGRPVGEKTAHQRNQSHQRNAGNAATRQTSDATAKTAAISRLATPNTVAHVSPRPSAAGPFSPSSPAQLGVNEYAGVAISAATHLRDIAPAPRPATSNTPSAASGTEWMNHLSQRRVTEVPDQFAK